ncbi:MAG: DUF58 domain-containing protein [Thermoguttaceae bacterium]
MGHPDSNPKSGMSLGEIIRQVRRVEIVARRAVDELFAGQYRSVFRGRGMEFSEVREYQPGDDVRAIDWNVTARQGHPYIKRFVEERELTVLFLVDLSASGLFGSLRRKWDVAMEVVATLMFSAMRGGDKVGLITFADSIVHHYPPRKGKHHVLHLLRELLGSEAIPARADLPMALDYMSRVQRRRAVIFLVSDFGDEIDVSDPFTPARHRHSPTASVFSSQKPLERALKHGSLRHDLMALVPSDPRESELPNVGLVTLRDAETGEIVTVDTASRVVRESLVKLAHQRRERLEATLQRARVELLTIPTDGDFLPELRRFFAARICTG